MKISQDKFNVLLILVFTTFISCKSNYTDISKEVTSVFNKYKNCIKNPDIKIKSDSLFCINKISDNFKFLRKYQRENSVEYLIFEENVSEFLVNSKIHQSILILKNKNYVVNIEGIAMFDKQSKLNKSFFETDAFKVRKIKKFNSNFYFIVKEYNAD
jgi:hypothetical protein